MTTGFCNKCGFSGQVGEFGQHLRPSDGRACSYMAGSPLAKPHPAPSPSEVGPEVVERAIGLAQWMEHVRGLHADYYTRWGFEAWERARAIVALLPEPVDADLIAAREMAAVEADKLGHKWVPRILAGEKDEDPQAGVSLALAAIKRGRALAAGDRS